MTGIDGIDRVLATGDEVIVDGERGLVVVAPNEAVTRFYESQREFLAAAALRLEKFRTARGASADGRRIEVGANVGTVEEARSAFENGAEGIGLFRTELMFLDRAEPPTEEEQYAILAETARLAAGRPVIVRTLDVGADKPLSWLRHLPERNPALGYRAIRMYAEHADLVEGQLRAILRAGAVGPVKVMFPMVGTPEEARELRALVEKVKGRLAAEGVAHDPAVEVGVMLEVPSAVLSVREIAREVDFFSVGSNDLAQYLFAVDREDTRLAHLGNPFHPAFLRLLEIAVEGAHEAGRWIGLCGELGGRPLAAPLLLGLGFDEVSVSPPRVLAAKAAFRRTRSDGARTLLTEALSKATAGEVESLLIERVPSTRALVDAGTVRSESGSRSREEAIRELADLLQLTLRVDDADRVEDAIWAYEETAPRGGRPRDRGPALRLASREGRLDRRRPPRSRRGVGRRSGAGVDGDPDRGAELGGRLPPSQDDRGALGKALRRRVPGTAPGRPRRRGRGSAPGGGVPVTRGGGRSPRNRLGRSRRVGRRSRPPPRGGSAPASRGSAPSSRRRTPGRSPCRRAGRRSCEEAGRGPPGGCPSRGRRGRPGRSRCARPSRSRSSSACGSSANPREGWPGSVGRARRRVRRAARRGCRATAGRSGSRRGAGGASRAAAGRSCACRPTTATCRRRGCRGA